MGIMLTCWYFSMVIVPKLGEGASTVINRGEEEEVWKVAIKSRNI